MAALLLPLLLSASPAAAAAISGTVFEDVNYGGGAGRSLAGSSGALRGGAIVELYDSAGAFLSFTTTDAFGDYRFNGIPPGNYTVRLVNSTVTSSRTGYVAGLLPVQTFRTDAGSGVALPVTDHVGGEIPGLVDAGDGATTLAALTTATTTAQSLSPVTLGATDVAGVDFGFNFNAIVNTNDSGQGSLRQFVLSSNALGNAGLAIQGQTSGRDVSVFMLSDGQAHAGLRAGIANLLSGAGVAVIAPVTALPAVADASTSVDGTTQTANVGDTNVFVLGTGGTVGVDGLALNTVVGPEVEIRGSGTLACGLQIQAANVVVRGLAILGFGTATGQAGVCVDAFPGALIENNVLGSSATSFADPGPAARNQAGVYSGGGSNGTVRNNLIGFGRVTGVYLNTGTAGWTITGNEIRDSGMDTADGDGITINAGTTNTSIGNLITGSSSQGFVVTVPPANGNVFTNNTVTGNGVGIPSGLVQSTAITLRAGATSTVLDRNVIRANYGAGVQANNGSTGTRMTRNSFADNGTITARNGGAATGQIGIDLNSPTDDADFGTAPFYTLNDAGDADTGGNGLLNSPVLASAALFGGNLSLRGYALPGSLIELFVASPDPTGFGEGTTYSITLTEGGTGAGGDDSYADTDARTGTYGPGPVNGIAQGTDTTNRFAFTFPVPGGIGVGTQLTATATLGGETSEFSGNVTVANATAVTLMSFEAAPSDGAVDLTWRTGSEVDNLGFHVYRSLSADGPWTRLTSSLIPGQGFSATGAAYTWRDSGRQNGTRYFYRLEDVDTRSVSTFHGPVSAVPQPGATPPPPPSEGGGSGGSGGSGSGGGASSSSCPAWALAQLGSSASYTCETHGDLTATSLRALSRTARFVVVELETGGFLTARNAAGRVRALVPGFDSLSDPLAPALPLKRARLDGVVGRQARIGSIQARENRFFSGLAAAVGYPQAVVAPDGTVQPGWREAEMALSRGAFPRVQARLAGEGFQGEDKTLALELMPLRYDASRGALVLSRRLTVRVDFAGAEPSEIGRGRLGRRLPRSRPDSSAYAFLATSQEGLHSVAFEALFPGRSRPLDLASLRLTKDQGRVLVPFLVLPQGPAFGPGSRLFFHVDATAASTSFSPEVVYALERGSGGVSMSLVPAPPDGSTAVSSRGFASFETNRLFAPDVLDIEDLWQWESLASGVSKTKPFALDGLDPSSPETARLVVYLQGGSDAVSVVDHHVQVFVNGALVAEESFDGAVPHRMEADVPVSLLAVANELRVLNVGDTGVSSRVFLDRFEVLYPQVGAARSGVFDGVFSAAGTAEVAGIASPTALLDVTAGASWLTGYEAGPSLRFRAEAGHRYLAVSPEALLAPRVFFPEPSARLRSTQNQADYVLVAPRAFLDAAQPLLDRRHSQGLTTFAASLEEIASSFGGGQPSAQAIRGFLSFAYHQWRRPSPRYVLLLGDANHDPRRFNPASQPSPMPFLLQKTSYIWTASDPALAALNGDDLLPDLAIGRLPATTLDQAQTMVAKILDWEAQGQNLDGKAALVADNPDLAGDFEADARDIESSFLAGRDTTEVFLGQLPNRDVARAQILDAFNQGLSLISYVGHGGGAVWAGENILNSSDPAALLAQPRQPFMLTMNCLNGYFIAPFYESLAEGFLKAQGKGTIAAFSPSGLSLDAPAHLYHRAVMQEITSGRHQRLGDAILAAQKTYAQSGAFPELLSLYHLFGDPAMRVRP
ncbi:MAG TPA: C25 family cysteine peptidase [Vicinamibacteria bacterium]|nr:C25 family cysteine peptidase [Vicinamibacteria bacterium]